MRGGLHFRAEHPGDAAGGPAGAVREVVAGIENEGRRHAHLFVVRRDDTGVFLDGL